MEETPANPDPSQPPRSPQRCISWRAAAQRHGGNAATLAPLENIRGAKAFSSASKVHLDGVDVLLTAGRPSTHGWRGGQGIPGLARAALRDGARCNVLGDVPRQARPTLPGSSTISKSSPSPPCTLAAASCCGGREGEGELCLLRGGDRIEGEKR